MRNQPRLAGAAVALFTAGAALLSAAAAALSSAAVPAPASPAVPSALAPGTPCSTATLPDGEKLPALEGCTIIDAAVDGAVAVATWHAPDGKNHRFGILAADRAAPRGSPVAFDISGCAHVGHAGDLTGDGIPDVVVRESGVYDCKRAVAERASDGLASYHVVGRRADGRFANLGSYNARTMDFAAGPGRFAGIPPFKTEPLDWVFDGRRFVRTPPAVKLVEVKGLRIRPAWHVLERDGSPPSDRRRRRRWSDVRGRGGSRRWRVGGAAG